VTDVIIVGDGPGGLSAALFLAKNNKSVTVYGQDKTAMHWAQLHNYLGVEDIHGSALQEIGRRQAQAFGATLVDARVESIASTGSDTAQQYTVTLEGGETASAGTIILSEGKSPRLASMLGLVHDPERGVPADRNGLTEVAGVYVVGRLARPGRSQAIISAGDGAAAAIDILSRACGENVADWDSPPSGDDG